MIRMIRILNITILIVIVLTVVSAYAINEPDNIVVLVPASHVTYAGSSSAIGGYAYNPTNGYFYTVTYGSNKSLRIFAGANGPVSSYCPSLLTTSDGNSWEVATESDLNRICGSTDVEGGLFNSNYPSSSIINGIILNPAPVTVNGYYYDAWKIAVLSNNTVAVDTASTKRLITWDLREIWSPTNVQPDNNNAAYDDAAPVGQRLEIEVFGQQYGYGCTNWNDTFRSLMTLGGMADAIGASVPSPTTTDNMGGRRVAFSSDASKIYFISMDSRTNRQFTGVWSVNVTTKAVKRLFDDRGSGSIITCSEPAAVPIGVRNFTHLPYDSHLDQVLFNGTLKSGNVGGINCLVDTDSNEPNVYPALDANVMLAFLGEDVNTPEPNRPKTWSIAADPSGNVYFYQRSPNSLYKYDTKGRLICVASPLQKYVFNILYGFGSSPSQNVENLRLSLRTIPAPYDANQQMVQLMSMSTAGKCVMGINVYKPCDFDRDGKITVADMNFFKTQIRRTRDANLPLIADGNAFLDYIKADLNGDGWLNSSTNPTGMAAACVTDKDMEILWQFVVPGDTNFDHKVDFRDFAALAANFNTPGDKNWSQGDFNFDGTVDIYDLELLMVHWLEDYSSHRVNFQDFAVLAANFKAPGQKNSLQGDYNFDGTVDIKDLELLKEHWLKVYE